MKEYLEEIRQCLAILKVFQIVTLFVVVMVGVRFNTFSDASQWKINRLLLAVSFVILVGMLVYEAFNYECMSKGFYGVPIGLQIVLLLVVIYFYFCKKGG